MLKVIPGPLTKLLTAADVVFSEAASTPICWGCKCMSETLRSLHALQAGTVLQQGVPKGRLGVAQTGVQVRRARARARRSRVGPVHPRVV